MEKNIASRLLKDIFYVESLPLIQHPCKQTSKNIWGKDIYIVKDDNIVAKTEVGNWLIITKFDFETATIDNIRKLCKQLAIRATKHEKRQLGNRNADNCTCYMLGDWHFLENEVGGIIRNGEIILVKYAKILEDVKND